MQHAFPLRTFIRFCSTMVRILNVAEKNDAAKSLADLMSHGRYRRRDGLSTFNKIYEFDIQLHGRQAAMVMTSVSGHLLTLEFPAAYRNWKSIDPEQLFDAPVAKTCPKNYEPILKTLEREVRTCNELIIWTDCDREGENIGMEVVQVCRSIKPNIVVHRAQFSEITPNAITRALNNLRQPDVNVSNAVDVRQELDLRIGAAFTRFQTLRLQSVFPTVLSNQLISYGSCQFPTLGFVVERYKQVQQFVPEPFWKIQVSHQAGTGKCDFNWKRQRLFDYNMARALYEHCMENPEAEVVDIKNKPKSRWRPAALDTIELEKQASRKLRISAKDTMTIAEKLYTKGYISYPRTETNKFPPDLNLVPLVQEQMQDQRFTNFCTDLLACGLTPRNGSKSDGAHPPIHPLKCPHGLQADEAKVFEYIVRHFLACCHKDAKGNETTVEIAINGERFTATGLAITERNYLEIFIYDKWTDKELPVYSAGDRFSPTSIGLVEGSTSPPDLLTEADLIALMDKHGIGTDATQADHIETIKSRLYVAVEQGHFVPGELGMGLVDGYDSMGFQMSKPNLRSNLEADLKKICEGSKDKDVVLQEQINNYLYVFQESRRQAQKLDEALAQYFGQPQQPTAYLPPPVVKVRSCPQCGSQIALKQRSNAPGFFLTCFGFPHCRYAVWFPDFVENVTVDDSVCPTCGPGEVKQLRFKVHRGSLPPSIQREFVACVGGCNPNLLEILNIRLPRIDDSGYNSSFTSVSSQRTPLTDHSNNNRQFPRQASTSQRGGSGSSRAPAPGHPQARQPRTNLNPQANQRGRRDSQRRGSGFSRVPAPGHLQVRHPSTNLNPQANQRGGEADIMCDCGLAAKKLQVGKKNSNQGRFFFRCSLPDGSGCKFFQWEDSIADGSAGQATTTQKRNPFGKL